MKNALSLGRHLARERARSRVVDNGVEPLIRRIAFAAKAIARESRRAPLVDTLGLAGDRGAPRANASRALDEFAHDALLGAFDGEGLIAALVVESHGEIDWCRLDAAADYLVCADVLDGAASAAVNGTLGSVFGIYRRRTERGAVDPESELIEGLPLVAAGFVMYGPATVLVYSARDGVFGFTLDHDLGEFLLSHGLVRCPADGLVVAAPFAKSDGWPPGVRATLAREGTSLRYSGTLVADAHRILLDGGVYFYPADAANPEGKLRYFFEAAPLAAIFEDAGAHASTGRGRIALHKPAGLDARVPVILGSRNIVDALLRAGDVDSPERGGETAP